MSKKEIKFTIKLNVDGKEQLGAITASAKDIKEAFDAAKTSTEKLSSSITGINQSFGALKALQDTMQKLIADSTAYSKAMTAVNTIAGKGADDFSRLKDQVSDLATTIPIARDQLANGLYQVISNGVPEDNQIDFLAQSARASVGCMADLGETVKVTSTMIKNYGLDWSEAADIQDKIQLAAKNGVTTFEEMAQALPRVASQASNLGVSVDELMASFATLTGVSGNTAEVSTQLAAIFTALIKPSSEATQMAEQMGIKFDAAAIKAAGGFQNFITQLDKDVKTFAAANGMLEQEVYGKLFGSAESLRAITPLTNQLAESFKKNTSDMQNSTGTVDEAFSTMAGTIGAKVQMLAANFAPLKDAITTIIAPITGIIAVTAQLGIVASSWGAITAAVTALRGIVVNLAATLTGLLTTAFTTVKTAITSLIASSTLLRTTMLSFRALASTVTISFQALRAGTISLGAAFRGAAVGATTLKMAIRGLLSATVVGAILVALGYALEALIEYLTGTADAADQASDKIDTLAQAQEQGRQASAQAQVEIDNEAKKLKALIDAHKDTTEAIRTLNSKYSEAFGYHKTAAEWYNILTTKSKLYAKQIGLEAQQRIIATQLAEKEIQLQEKYAQRKALWESGKAQVLAYNTNTGKGEQADSPEYTTLKNECRTLIAETNQLKSRLGIIDTQMASVAKQMQSTASSAKDTNKAVNTMTYEEVDKALDSVLDKMKRTTDKKQLQELNREYQKLIARQKQLQGLGVQTSKTPPKKTKTPTKTKPEPKYYANPTNEQQLTKNINYYSGRLNGQDTAEQRQLIANIQQWRQKRKEIELTKKAALVPAELNTAEAVNAKLDYLRALRDASPADKQDNINHQIAQTELRGLQLQRPTTIDANSSDDDIAREIAYQQKLKAITTGNTDAIEAEIKRLQRLKLTESEKLQAALTDAQEEFDNAPTIQARVQASAKIAELQQQIDTATSGELTITAPVQPTYIAKGTIQDKRQSIANAQQRAQLVQSDYDSGIIDQKEAQRQIDQINAQLATLGKDIKPITLEIRGKDKLKEATDAINSLGSSLGNLGDSIGVPELNVAGTMAQAIATMVAGYATATTQAATMGPWAWIAFAAVGLAELAAMISSVKSMGQYATGGIVPGTSYTGDRITARVNSGEMILNARQQARLFALANGAAITAQTTSINPTTPTPTLNLAALRANIRPQQLDVNVSGRISGRDLKLILDKRNTILSRS